MTQARYVRGALVQGPSAVWLQRLLTQDRPRWAGFHPVLRAELEALFAGVVAAAEDWHDQGVTSVDGSAEVPSTPVLPASTHDDIDIATAAGMLGVSRRQAINVVRDNELGKLRARRWCVSRAALLAHLADRRSA